MSEETQQEMNTEQSEENTVTEQQSEEMQQQTTEETPDNGNGVEEVDEDTEDERKMFVGGINWDTTTPKLKEYFEKYGKVLDCTLKKDYETQKSRGFGFVLFAHTDAVEKVLAQEKHVLDDRTLDAKLATPRLKKIFVGKLDQDVTKEEIQEYFSKYGEVMKIDLPVDRNSEKRRAFCFVEFTKMTSFKKCLEETSHSIKGKEVDVKKATIQQGGGRGGMRGGRGGPGQGGRGGRGGYQGQYGGGGGGGGYGAGYQYPYYDASYYDGSYYDPYYGSNYYQGWGGAGYQQGGYNYGGYGGGSNQANYGKSQKRGGGQGYHPYNR